MINCQENSQFLYKTMLTTSFKKTLRKFSTYLILLSAICFEARILTTKLSAGLYSESSGQYGIANREIIRRQERIINAREKVMQGDEAYRDKDFQQASLLYKEAVELIPVAPISNELRSGAVERYAIASLRLAKQRAAEGFVEEAKSITQSILSLDEDYSPAQKMLAELNDPEVYSPAMTPEHAANVKKVEENLRNARSNYELGKFDNAMDSYNTVLNIDPYNKAARRGMEAVNNEQERYNIAAYNQARAELLGRVTEAWALPVKRQGFDGSDNIIDIARTTSLSDKIKQKLRTIRIPKVSFNQTPIREALRFLEARSKELDYDRENPGINFIMDVGEGNEEFDVDSLPPLTFDLENAPLIQTLDYATRLTNLKYKVEDYAVVILPKTEYRPEFEQRIFRVPPAFFAQGESGSGSVATIDPFAPVAADAVGGAGAVKPKLKAREVLEERGVDFPEGATAFYNHGTSTLVVFNTQKSMEQIESLLSVYTSEKVAKQINIKAKFVEVRQENLDELGFDWLIGPFNLGSSDRVFGSGGTVGNQRGAVDSNDFPFVPPGTDNQPIGLNPVTSGLRTGGIANQSEAIDSLLTESIGLTSLGPAVAAFSGVFTDPQFQVVIRALAQKRGTDLLSAPSVTVKPGSQAVLSVVRELIYPTQYDPPQIPNEFGNISTTTGTFGLGGIGSASVNSFPVTPATPTTFETRNTGVTLTTTPQLDPDGYKIDLDLSPETVEFEGFINYGTPIRSGAIDSFGRPTTVTLTDNEIKMPVFATRKVDTSVSVWDGHTVALGGLIREDVQHTQDKVPLLGDLPLIGRLFRSESERHLKRNLVIFVTAQLIDPSGQPINKIRQSLSSEGSGNEFSSSSATSNDLFR